MSDERGTNDLYNVSLAGLQTCAGYLNCIFERMQADRPLTRQEQEAAWDQGANKVYDLLDPLQERDSVKKYPKGVA